MARRYVRLRFFNKRLHYGQKCFDAIDQPNFRKTIQHSHDTADADWA